MTLNTFKLTTFTIASGLFLASCGQHETTAASNSQSANARTYVSSQIVVPKSFLAPAFSKTVRETVPVSEVVNGVRIRGSALNVGETYLEFVPNSQHAEFDVLYKGTSTSTTTGTARAGLFGKGSVTVRASGSTGIHARKANFFDQNGYSSTRPKANSSTKLTITGISYNAAVGEREARRRIYAERPSNEAALNRRTEARTNEMLHEQVVAELSKAQAQYKKSFLDPMIKTGFYPGQLATSSTSENLNIVTNQPLDALIGEVQPRIVLNGGEGLINFSFHEGLINGTAFKMFAGKKMTLVEMKEKLSSLLNRPSEPGDEDDSKYSISFPDDKYPVEVRIDGGQMTILIRSTGYYIKDIQQPSMNVSTSYVLSISDDGRLKGVRQGSIVVLPPGYSEGDALSTRQRDMQRKLKARYAKEFKEEFVTEPPMMAGGSYSGEDSLIKDLGAEKGWLVLLLDRK